MADTSDWYENWQRAHDTQACTCGLYKTYGQSTNLTHSPYCNLYVKTVNMHCNCTPGGWHSPLCINRAPEPEKEKVRDWNGEAKILLEAYNKKVASKNKY